MIATHTPVFNYTTFESWTKSLVNAFASNEPLQASVRKTWPKNSA
jgi:hypothetical protein